MAEHASIPNSLERRYIEVARPTSSLSSPSIPGLCGAVKMRRSDQLLRVDSDFWAFEAKSTLIGASAPRANTARSSFSHSSCQRRCITPQGTATA